MDGEEDDDESGGKGQMRGGKEAVDNVAVSAFGEAPP